MSEKPRSPKIGESVRISEDVTKFKQYRPGVRHPEKPEVAKTIDAVDDNVPETGPVEPGSRAEQIAKLKKQIDALQLIEKKVDRLDRRHALEKKGRLAEEVGEGLGKDPETTGETATKETASATPEAAPAPESASEAGTKTEAEAGKKTPEDMGGPFGVGFNTILEAQSGGPKSKKGEKAPEIDESLASNDQKILRSVFASRGFVAMKEMEKQMKMDTIPGSKRTKEDHRTNSLKYAEKMFSAESDYFAALKKFHKTKGFQSVMGDQFNPDGRKLPPEVQSLKDAWIASRTEYAGFMRGSVTSRLKEKHAKGDRGATEKLASHKVMERYQRRFITKEVVLGAEEAENRARLEGLSSRDKKGFEKLFSQFKKLSPALRAFSTSAMIAGGVGAVAAGSMLYGPILLAMGGASFVTTVAAARAKEGSAAKSFWTKAAAVTSIGGIFGFLGDKAVRGVHAGIGTKKNADKKLAQREGLGDLSNPDTFKKMAGGRKKATLAQENIDSDARIGRFAAATVGGAVVGGALHNLDHGGPTGVATPHHGGPTGAPTYPHDHESVVVGGKINDADRLMGHFALKLQKDFPVGTARPPAVEKFLEALQANKGGNPLEYDAHHSVEDHASIFNTHFEQADGTSTVVQPGDTISFEHGQIILTRPHHPEMNQILADDKGVHAVDPKIWHQAPVHRAEGAPRAHSSADDAAAPMSGRHGPLSSETDPDVPPAHGTPSHAETSASSSTGITQESYEKEYANLDAMYKAGKGGTPEFAAAAATHQAHEAAYNALQSHATAAHESVPTTPAQTPDSAPEITETVSAPHPFVEFHNKDTFFASPSVHDINPHGVDLGKPDVLLNHNHVFAHGADNNDSFARAAEYLKKMQGQPGNPIDSRVYFVARNVDAAGVAHFKVEGVILPPGGGEPQLWAGPQTDFPPLPNDSDYMPVPEFY